MDFGAQGHFSIALNDCLHQPPLTYSQVGSLQILKRMISMSRNLLPSKWKTERLNMADSTLDELPELQKLNAAVPQTQSWMRVEGQDTTECSMLSALEEGVLPPTPNRSKEFFRLQSIRLENSNGLIGFLGVYHGFPQTDIFWINTLTFHPKYQGMGYGPELMVGLSEIVKQLGDYSRMRTYVELTNWPSLRLCVKVGMNKMVEIVGDKDHSDKAEAHVLLEKTFEGS
jgi:ribosomal protein S18 acetylase RimI-like enzyme